MSKKDRLPPIHPGEILREEFLGPLGMSAHELSMALRVPATRINDIVNEKRGITADTALRLARYFGTTSRFWMNLQASWELEVAEDEVGSSGRSGRFAENGVKRQHSEASASVPCGTARLAGIHEAVLVPACLAVHDVIRYANPADPVRLVPPKIEGRQRSNSGLPQKYFFQPRRADL